MKKIFKGVKRAFKKVARVVKKIAPVVLAGAVVFFTAGAALTGGIAGSLGAWGKAVTGFVGKFAGTNSMLGKVLSGAITDAGVGALTSGAVSKAMGGSFREGAEMGAGIGAITGAGRGLIGHLNAPKTTDASNMVAQHDPTVDAAAAQGRAEMMSTDINPANPAHVNTPGRPQIQGVPVDTSASVGPPMTAASASAPAASAPTPTAKPGLLKAAGQTAGKVLDNVGNFADKHGAWLGPALITAGTTYANRKAQEPYIYNLDAPWADWYQEA